MRSLYVTDPGAVLRLDGATILVTGQDRLTGISGMMAAVDVSSLDRIVLLGPIHMTRQALQQCLHRGVTVAWADGSGAFRGLASALAPPAAETVLCHATAHADAGLRQAFARQFVVEKCRVMLEALNDYRANYPDAAALSAATTAVEASQAAAAHCTGLDNLRGFEGAASAAWYQAVRCLLRPPFVFEARRRMPPTDPVNAMLSMGYTLLANLADTILRAHGLLTTLGFLHQHRAGSPALALDLMEEFRVSVVDRLVLRLCNRRMVSNSDFETRPDGAVHFSRPALKEFLREFESTLRHPRAATGSPLEVMDQRASQLRHQICNPAGMQPC